MQIELDDATRRDVIAQAKAQMLAELMKQFNVKQIAAEIRNEAINKAAKELAQLMIKDTNTERHVRRALESVQDRLNSKLHSVLAKGITVRLEGLNSLNEAEQ